MVWWWGWIWCWMLVVVVVPWWGPVDSSLWGLPPIGAISRTAAPAALPTRPPPLRPPLNTLHTVGWHCNCSTFLTLEWTLRQIQSNRLEMRIKARIHCRTYKWKRISFDILITVHYFKHSIRTTHSRGQDQGACQRMEGGQHRIKEVFRNLAKSQEKIWQNDEWVW